MEIVKILGVDPSLRNTGMAIVSYNCEKQPSDPEAYLVSDAQVLINPAKYKGTDAILNMIDMVSTEANKACYRNADTVIIESPPIMFNKSWSGGTISSLSHVSGACIALLGVEKSYIFRPNEWNKSRKKEITHAKSVALLGSPDDWHYASRVKNEKNMEHILDAVSMALYWIQSNYFEE